MQRLADEPRQIDVFGTVMPVVEEVQEAVISTKPKRVLHCVERMHTNAIENWLLRMYRYGRAQGVPLDWTFHVQSEEPGVLESVEPEIVDRIVRSRWSFSQPTKFVSEFREMCRQGGYEVIHIHGDLMAAPYILGALRGTDAKRFVHVHNADENIPTSGKTKARILRWIFREICMRLSDRVIGISQHTLDTFLAGRKRRPDKDTVHYYGIDPSSFISADADRIGFRRSNDLPEDSIVLLFASRMVPEKNPLFAVEVLAELCTAVPRVFGVFVGAGSLEGAVAARANELGIASRLRMLGYRADVPAIMKASDLFILPRPECPKEGLGIAVIEAQLAGLRLLLSNGIADDPLLPNACFNRLPLADGAKSWARVAVELLKQTPPTSVEAVAQLSKSPFNMEHAFRELISLYG